MKRALIVVACFFLLLDLQAQTAAPAEPAYVRNPDFPPIRLLEVDSLHFVTKADIKKNKKVLLLFFSPDCEHCKHQIRDIGQLLSLPVQRLIRVRLGSLRLGNLPPGEWRHLTEGEVKLLRAMGKVVATAPNQRRASPTRGARSARRPAAPEPGAASPGRRPRQPTADSKRAR